MIGLRLDGYDPDLHHDAAVAFCIRASVLIHLKYEKNREDIGLFGIWRD